MTELFEDAMLILETAEERHAQSIGVSPPIISLDVKGYVIIAGVDGDAPTLEIVTMKQLIGRYLEALADQKDFGAEDHDIYDSWIEVDYPEEESGLTV